MEEIEIDWVREAIVACGSEVSVYDDYRGRGMYEQTCFGVVGSNAALLEFMVALTIEAIMDSFPDCERAADQMATMARKTRVDNMARDMIFYWPDFKLSAAWEDDESDNEGYE